MSDLNYYAHPTVYGPPHRGGLTAWGVVLIIIGGFFTLSALITLTLGIVLLAKWTGTNSFDGQTIVALFVQSVSTGAVSWGLIWIGIGTCRGRRWVAPVLEAGAWLTVALGIVTLIPLSVVLATVVTQNPATAAPGVAKPFIIVGILAGVGMSVAMFIGLPVGIIAWFRRPSVHHTLAVLDPASRWTDNVSIPRLVWVMACILSGLSIAATSGTGMWFFFTVFLQGWAAAVGIVVGVTLVAAGFGCFRRSSMAWTIAVALFALQSVSSATFSIAGDQQDYRDQIIRRTATFSTLFTPRTATPPTQTNPIVGQVNPTVTPAILYAAAVFFGVWVRPKVVGDGAEPAGA